MARELGDYLDELVQQRGEPTDWVAANRLVQDAVLALGINRQQKYGHANIAAFGELGICVRANDKIQRAWHMLQTRQTDATESIADSFGDLGNYGCYGVMLSRNWWGLPLAEDDTEQKAAHASESVTGPMRVYLCAQYGRRGEMREYAADVEALLGYKVVSTWIDTYNEQPEDGESTEDAYHRWAERDLVELEMAEIIIAFTEDESATVPRGSRHVEFGYALARGIGIIAVGPCETIFHALPDVARVPDWQYAMKILRNWRERAA